MSHNFLPVLTDARCAGGSIHLFFEGYFSVNHARMAGRQDFFGQLWKEYSMSDSRYLTSDPFVLCMESVTAVCSCLFLSRHIPLLPSSSIFHAT